MAITVTDRGLTHTTPGVSATNTIASASFTPAASAMIVSAFVGTWQQGAVGTHSVTDSFSSDNTAQARQAFCRRATVNPGQYAEHAGIWTAICGATPGSGAATGTRDTGTVDQDIGIFVLELTGAATSSFVGGTTGTTDRQAAGPSTFTLDLGSAPASDSLIVTVCYVDAGTTVPTAPSGYTAGSSFTDGTGDDTGVYTIAWKNGGGSQTLQWTALDTANAHLAAAVEIKAAPSTRVVEAPLLAKPPGRISPVGKIVALGDPNVRGQAVYPDNVVTATGTANDPTATVSPVPAQATATGTANLPGFTIAPNGPAAATGTATGNAPTSRLAPNAGSASGTATANQPSGFTVSFTPSSVATATATAQPVTPTVLVNAGVATATATANDPTVTTSGGSATNADAGVATATATANNTSATVKPTLTAAATATATANNPTVNTTGQTQAPAGVGTATATANLPGFTVTVNAGVATATAAVNGAVAQLGPSPANAQAAATAYVTSAAALVAAAVATATATGNNGTGFNGIVTTALTDVIKYRHPGVIKYRPR